jgi:hypothetical protein
MVAAHSARKGTLGLRAPDLGRGRQKESEATIRSTGVLDHWEQPTKLHYPSSSLKMERDPASAVRSSCQGSKPNQTSRNHCRILTRTRAVGRRVRKKGKSGKLWLRALQVQAESFGLFSTLDTRTSTAGASSEQLLAPRRGTRQFDVLAAEAFTRKDVSS